MPALCFHEACAWPQKCRSCASGKPRLCNGKAAIAALTALQQEWRAGGQNPPAGGKESQTGREAPAAGGETPPAGEESQTSAGASQAGGETAAPLAWATGRLLTDVQAGVRVDVVAYADPGGGMLLIANQGLQHDRERNMCAPTSVAKKIDIANQCRTRVEGGDWGKVAQKLLNSWGWATGGQ